MDTLVVENPKLEISGDILRILNKADVREVKISEITHLGWQAVEVKYSMGGNTHEANIALVTEAMLKENQILSLYWFPRMFGRFYNTSEKISTPRQFYINLCEMTWDKRYTQRKNELDSIGYFEYFGTKFYSDGRVSFHDGSTINLMDMQFSRMGHHLMANKKPSEGFLSKIKSRFNGYGIVDMQMDTDAMRQLIIDIINFDFFTIWGQGFLQSKPTKK
ncbi:MAG: hypothetical protein WC959_08695 [Kiritimatiellales bacterium]